MLRDLLSSRAILAGIVFFVLMVGGTQLYRWHVLRTPAAALPQTRNTEPALETTDKTRTTPETQPSEFKPPGFVDTPDEKIDAQSTTATDTSPE